MSRPDSRSARADDAREPVRERLSPPPRLSGSERPRRRQDSGRGTGALGVALLAVLVALALFVVFGLPRLAERSAAGREADTTTSPLEAAPLEPPSSSTSTPSDLEAAPAGAKTAGSEPEDSGSGGVQESEGAGPVGGDSGRAIASALAQADEALAAGDAYAAQRAYRDVLELAPESPEARRGLARAERLDRVRGLLASAAAAEESGQRAEAARLYREVLALDRSSTAAREGLGRLEARSSDERFRAAVSQALTALDDTDLETARAAAERAASLRPEASEVRDLRQRIEREAEARRLRNLEERARAAERDERWEDAAEAWGAAAEIDSSLTAARAGKSRSLERARLDRRLGSHLERPDRLSDAAVWEEAREALMVAREIPEPGPRLRRQVEQLAELVARMSVTVPVVLVSDGETEVTVYRVGRLGTFSRRELELRPGSYTVIGTREGFRDVRRELVVTPGEPRSLEVRCQERVG